MAGFRGPWLEDKVLLKKSPGPGGGGGGGNPDPGSGGGIGGPNPGSGGGAGGDGAWKSLQPSESWGGSEGPDAK